jgi:hypothetical protein
VGKQQGDLGVIYHSASTFLPRTRQAVWAAVIGAALVGLSLAQPLYAADPWPSVQPGGRAALQALSAELEQRGQAIAAAVRAEREGCEISRTKGKPCSGALLDALTGLLAVVNSMDRLQKHVASRLAELPAAQLEADRKACEASKEPPACERLRADDAALDGFGQLRVAPALESLGRLAQEASRDLQLAKAMHASSSQKLPAPAPGKARDPRLDQEIRVQADGTEGAPPPPPPGQLLSLCKKGGQAKGGEEKAGADKGGDAKAGQGQACMTVGGIYEARRELTKAREYYRLACKNEVKQGCEKAEALKKARK